MTLKIKNIKIRSDAIVAEMWKPASVPVGVQKMVDRFGQEGKLSSDTADEQAENGTDNENKEVLLVQDEPFAVTRFLNF